MTELEYESRQSVLPLTHIGHCVKLDFKIVSYAKTKVGSKWIIEL